MKHLVTGIGSVGVQGGKRSMKSKSKSLCCYFHSAYVSVRVVQVPKRGLDLSLLDSPTSTADNSERSMKSKSKSLCCYFHSAYVSVRVVQVPKRGLDLSLLDSPTSTADNSVIFKADD